MNLNVLNMDRLGQVLAFTQKQDIFGLVGLISSLKICFVSH